MEQMELLQSWVRVSSGSEDVEGLRKMLSLLQEAFTPLGGKLEVVALPPRTSVDGDGVPHTKPCGHALKISKYKEAKERVLLVGHMDTVFAKAHPMRLEKIRLYGPGVVDMKGGLVIMLEALKALEASDVAGKLGWEVLITPDEEVGSTSSRDLLMKTASQASFGLVFEPSLPDGTLVSARKSSATLSIISRGKSAHVGRAFHTGKNAIVALAAFICEIEKWNSPEVIVNVGQIHGGKGANVVPDFAMCKINIRSNSNLEPLIKKIKEREFEVIVHSIRPPKPFDKETEKLFEEFKECGKKRGVDIKWQPSGGVCDGNFLAAAGLPTIDTVGAIGGNLHTVDEYIEIESLLSRSQLVADFLINRSK